VCRCTYCHTAKWICWFFTSSYLQSWSLRVKIWRDFAMVPTTSEHKMLCKSRRKCDGNLAMIRQAFGEKCMAIHGKSKLSESEISRQVKNKVKSIYFYMSRKMFSSTQIECHWSSPWANRHMDWVILAPTNSWKPYCSANKKHSNTSTMFKYTLLHRAVGRHILYCTGSPDISILLLMQIVPGCFLTWLRQMLKVISLTRLHCTSHCIFHLT
jgi:hypothetical protein